MVDCTWEVYPGSSRHTLGAINQRAKWKEIVKGSAMDAEENMDFLLSGKRSGFGAGLPML